MARNLNELLKDTPLLMAPMAGITDRAFRHLALEHGAALTFTEMVSITGLDYGDKTTWSLVTPADNESRVAVQLFGADPRRAERVVQKLMDKMGEKIALIDINMACPVRKVTRRGEGAALMRTPEIAAELIGALVKSADIPVTAKIRRGFQVEEPTYRSFAQMLIESGVSAIGLHGRSASQMYKDTADWMAIEELCQISAVPIIGSGDIRNAQVAFVRSGTPGISGLFAARGALGNPWIFSQYNALQAGSEMVFPSLSQRHAVMRRHIELHERYDGNPVRLRKDFAWYMSGMSGAARKRETVMRCRSFDDLKDFVRRLEDDVD